MSITKLDLVKAPAINTANGNRQILLCSHGIYGGPGVVECHAETLNARLAKADVDVCCLLGSPNIAEILPTRTGELTIVPVLMADGFTMNKLRETVAELAVDTKATVTITPPIGAMPELTELLINVSLESCKQRGWLPAATNILLAAHGSKRVSTTSKTTLFHLDRIRRQNHFAEVEAAFLDQEPFIADKLAAWRQSNSILVGLFNDAGPHGKDDLQDLANQHNGAVEFTGPIGIHVDYANLIGDLIQSISSD